MNGKLKILILTLLALLTLSSCESRDGFGAEDFDSSDVCLRVKGKMVFEYVPQSCQIAFNRGRKEFRAGTDTMSDYFLLKLSSIPWEPGQVVSASLQWTTSDNMVSLDKLNFEVEDVRDDGKMWLWCPSQKINVVIRLPE